MKKIELLSYLFLTFGLIGTGFLASDGLKRFSSGNRVVSVKGVAEREVESDMAYWSIRHISKAPTLDQTRVKLKESQKAVRDYLKKYGIKEEEISVKRVEVQEISIPDEFGRYTKTSFQLSENLMVRSDRPLMIENASQAVSELIDQGVFLEGHYSSEAEPVYAFTKLNDYKPEMIAEATKSAREAAQQFASDSNSQIGKIKTANQGLFQILGRDKVFNLSEHSQREKTLRVVVSLDYYLE